MQIHDPSSLRKKNETKSPVIPQNYHMENNLTFLNNNFYLFIYLFYKK